MTRRFVLALLLLLVAIQLVLPPAAEGQIKVVTSTSDLYDIARSIGGSRIAAKHISEGYQDPHFVEAKPSFVLDLRKADVWAFVGLDLEIGWMSLLLDGARNSKIRPGGSGYLDVSKAASIVDVPSGNVDRSQGDVHPLGNPHYWLDPENGKRIGRLFRGKFAELDPAGATHYADNLARFETSIDAAAKGWAAELAILKGKPIVAWHTSWRYFAAYTGVDIVGFMEPKPGVPPSPSHLAALVQTIKRTGAKAIIMEPFYARKTADFVAEKTGATVVVLPPSVGGRKGLDDYLAVLRHNISALAQAVR